MINISRNGYSYSFVQPELCYTHGNLLVSARASFMPYNTTLPDIEEITRRDGRAEGNATSTTWPSWRWASVSSCSLAKAEAELQKSRWRALKMHDRLFSRFQRAVG